MPLDLTYDGSVVRLQWRDTASPLRPVRAQDGSPFGFAASQAALRDCGTKLDGSGYFWDTQENAQKVLDDITRALQGEDVLVRHKD